MQTGRRLKGNTHETGVVRNTKDISSYSIATICCSQVNLIFLIAKAKVWLYREVSFGGISNGCNPKYAISLIYLPF
jgi:hypothetical protein